ncbi:MAG: NAD(P)-binding domain-containing protein [Rhodomicrobiaceae bacterium]
MRGRPIATGHCDLPLIPSVAKSIGAPHIHSSAYRSPGALPDGNVLVVGASSSGVQIASELQRSGRQVTLAVGKHTRLPRSYRGIDIFRWFERMGVLDQPWSDVSDLVAARLQPSLQLAGRPDRSNLDLAVLQDEGVKLTAALPAVSAIR